MTAHDHEPLTLRGFHYRYPTTDSWALRDVDLDVGAGLTLVSGESGSGKSTLLRVSNGLVPHFHGGTVAGVAHVAGRSILSTPTRDLARHVGFLFQDSELQSVYATVERDVAFGLENLGVERGQMVDRVDEALSRLGIEHLRTRGVATLSGGERQRLALAGVLAMRPALLALDEPLSQLDPEAVPAFVSFLAETAASGAAVLVAEHRLDHLLGIAASLAIVAGEHLFGPGPVPDLVDSVVHPPDVVALGRRLRWTPPALDVDGARGRLQVVVRSDGHSPGPSGPVAWELRDASLDAGRQPILSAVDLRGRAGEVTVLMGPNGGGKTTLLRGIAGLITPRSGSAERAPGRVAYLPQNPTALLHRATVRAEVEFTLRRAAETEAPDAILGRLGLLHVAHRYPRDLSSGERQRAAIAAVLAGTPAVALLDEPTRGMDGAARRALTALVRDLAALGTSVVVATHDSDLAAAVGQRVLRVAGGSVRDLGPPASALRGDTPYATQIGRLFATGPITLDEALAAL